jgi:hypothetical protein
VDIEPIKHGELPVQLRDYKLLNDSDPFSYTIEQAKQEGNSD